MQKYVERLFIILIVRNIANVYEGCGWRVASKVDYAGGDCFGEADALLCCFYCLLRLRLAMTVLPLEVWVGSVASDCCFVVGGVAFDNSTSPPSPLLKERGDSPIVVLWLGV